MAILWTLAEDSLVVTPDHGKGSPLQSSHKTTGQPCKTEILRLPVSLRLEATQAPFCEDWNFAIVDCPAWAMHAWSNRVHGVLCGTWHHFEVTHVKRKRRRALGVKSQDRGRREHFREGRVGSQRLMGTRATRCS